MPRLSYVNGKYLPHSKAVVSIEDRGLQFSDGVYEVIAVYNSFPVDLKRHINRLQRSMRELSFEYPPNIDSLLVVLRNIIRLNKIKNGNIYVQINRGVSPRNHLFPEDKISCTRIVTARSSLNPSNTYLDKGVSLSSQADIRWGRCDIKTVGLLGNVLTKQTAKTRGAFESILLGVDDTVTEASTANIWIVNKKKQLLTHPESQRILSGVTRNRIIDLIKDSGLEIIEKPFKLEDSLGAEEVFLTGTTISIIPVIEIDKTFISTGKPGPVTLEIISLYRTYLNSLDYDSSWNIN